MKGGERHSSLLTLRSSLNFRGGERNRTSLLANITWQLSPCALPPAASSLPGTLPGSFARLSGLSS